MAKIPLERTIGDTYRFAFTNILSILGTVWLPYAIIAAMVGGVIYLVLPDFRGLDFSDHADIARNHLQTAQIYFHVRPFISLIQLVGFVVQAMVAVGLMRKALGLHPGPVFVYFSLGAPVWRMIGARIVAAILIGVAILLLIGAGALLVWAARTLVPAATPLVTGLAICAGVVAAVYIAVRLAFFLPAVVVAEGRIGIVRAWELGRGNFWRIVVLMIAVILPVLIVSWIIGAILFTQMFSGVFQQLISAHHPIAPHDAFAIVLPALRQAGPVFLVYYVLVLAILAGLGSGAIAKAYNAVTTTEAHA